MHEGIPIINYHVPKAFVHEDGRLQGMTLRDRQGGLRRARAGASWCPPASPMPSSNATRCWSRWARRTRFRGSSATAASPSTSGACRCCDKDTFQSTVPNVFFGGDAAFGPKNIITAVAHGHEAAVSIDRLLHGEDTYVRPAPMTNLMSQKMGIHEWSYDNDTVERPRFKVPWAKAEKALASIKVEVELGFDVATAFKEAQRCLNCDVQTVFTETACIECDACVDICPMDCISFTDNGDGGRPANAPEGAGAQPGAGPVCVRRPEDRAG